MRGRSGGATGRGRRAGAVLAVLALCAAAGCQDSRALTGTFRSTEPVVIADVPGLEGGVWIELVLGHFGPDVAGIVRFYQEDFILPVTDACACRFLHEGRFEDEQLKFFFATPSPCTEKPGLLLAARLDISRDRDSLEGPLGATLEGARRWTFVREKDAADLGDKDRECKELDLTGTGSADLRVPTDVTEGEP